MPGSKSISNRVLLMAALGQGTCRLKGLLHSDDTKVRLFEVLISAVLVAMLVLSTLLVADVSFPVVIRYMCR